jgi:hypothetical protein
MVEYHPNVLLRRQPEYQQTVERSFGNVFGLFLDPTIN